MLERAPAGFQEGLQPGACKRGVVPGKQRLPMLSVWYQRRCLAGRQCQSLQVFKSHMRHVASQGNAKPTPRRRLRKTQKGRKASQRAYAGGRVFEAYKVALFCKICIGRVHTHQHHLPTQLYRHPPMLLHNIKTLLPLQKPLRKTLHPLCAPSHKQPHHTWTHKVSPSNSCNAASNFCGPRRASESRHKM